MKNNITLIIVSVILSVGVIGGALISANNKVKLVELGAQLALEEKTRSLELRQACYNDSYDVYLENWNTHCELLNLEPDCVLDLVDAERFEKIYRSDLDRCEI